MTLLAPPERPAYVRTTSATSQVSQSSLKSSKTNSISRTFSRQKDKPRLYLALLPRGGTGSTYSAHETCDSYHWALIIGPKSPLRSEAGTAYHILHASSPTGDTSYFYEETDLSQHAHQSRAILCRITVAKVLDADRITELLRSTARQSDTHSARRKDSITEATFSCLDWTREAFSLLTSDPQRSLKSYFGPEDWNAIENRTRLYVKRKRVQGRFQAQQEHGRATWNPDEIPTWNYWENRETTD